MAIYLKEFVATHNYGMTGKMDAAARLFCVQNFRQLKCISRRIPSQQPANIIYTFQTAVHIEKYALS
jgi:hypothetical protein